MDNGVTEMTKADAFMLIGYIVAAIIGCFFIIAPFAANPAFWD